MQNSTNPDLFSVYDVYTSPQLKEQLDKEKNIVYNIEAVLNSRGEYEYENTKSIDLNNIKVQEEVVTLNLNDCEKAVLVDKEKEAVKKLVDIFDKSVEIVNSKIKGVKHNSNKPSLDIVLNRQFPKALQLISLATEFGHNKYKEVDTDYLNFKNVQGGSQTYFDAAARHNTERDNRDSQSNLPHIIHVAWNYLAGLELWAEENQINVKEFTEKYLSELQNSK